MTMDEACRMVDWLNQRMRKMRPWWQWSVMVTWEKLQRWAERLGYKA